MVNMGFRPLFGDLSSIRVDRIVLTEPTEFPSPLRGLIFHSEGTVIIMTQAEFPSPLRGLIFHSIRI